MEDDSPGRSLVILVFALIALPASAAPSSRIPDERCDLDGPRAERMQRFARARLVPQLGVSAVADAREAAVFAWVGWPLDRPLPPGLATSPSLAARREALAERGLKLRRARADLARGRRWASLRDAIDAALDLEEVDAERAALEECP